ncbi:tRNA (N(6)-L-threonylcarbamoyladenosine(37)-C(2))-methylthiotransferase MtaB [Anoxybacter fermentans]|uniref:Threonylcarbamoyladenosine tRNA methylthiotransferase MtaB n=1 Tax=Anoxybacter fermentans TaxID=1323375 RepID=A0A3Q9HQ32_9FIRM|nr:tRNA (N(6)-L-threonylcarbamoyladenosine(37)-C(2))-methylthiotransferase MtaB [Anoxybacter fermentans]AZR73169.1 tRNA (N(6)-L-threonylcarbamoyladenosine(37)-C(2))-methylthiotransferase MtaB [Anoxybacter fermentans]
MKKVAFNTLGCKVNQYDTESMMKLFEEAGYEIVDFKDKADVYVINTCTVTHEGARKSRQMARQAKRRNPESIVAVVGCYAQVAPDEVIKIDGVDLVVGTKSRNELVELVEKAKETDLPLNCVEAMEEKEEFEELPVEEFKGRTRAVIKVEDGCNQYCSYCIIPYARGPVRSRRPGNAVKEIQTLVQVGVKEVVLTGIHLGAYGQDLGPDMNLVELIKMLIKIEGLERIRLSSIEITEVDDEMIDLLANEPKFCPHLHLPLQSGSDTILKAMNRPYTTEEFASVVEKIRSRVPDIAITTDVMVGFPGETDELFEETYRFIEKIGFSQLHVFKYSIRQGTPAAKMKNQVSHQVKNVRSEKLRLLGERLTLEYNQKFLNKVLPVLIEEERDQSTGMLTGVTPNYIRVYIDEESNKVKGKILPVKLVKSYGTKAVLGKL